jgi:hypothetical protein
MSQGQSVFVFNTGVSDHVGCNLEFVVVEVVLRLFGCAHISAGRQEGSDRSGEI